MNVWQRCGNLDRVCDAAAAAVGRRSATVVAFGDIVLTTLQDIARSVVLF